MRNTEEKLLRMHERATELQEKRDRTVTRIMGSVSAVLMACLVVLIQQLQDMQSGIMAGQNTGSSMLGESTGGYVMIAVIAFTIGAIITALIFRYRNRDDDQKRT